MRTAAVIVCVALGLGITLGAGQPTAAPSKAAPDLTPQQANERSNPALVEFFGADGKITSPEFCRITDSDAWLALWSHHTGIDKAQLSWSGAFPKVDFSRCMVVAYFRGNAVNTQGEELKSADEVDGKLRLRICSLGYQTMSIKGEDHGIDAVSFGIWILPRNAKPIIIEENVQNLIGKPPVWKQQKSFEALRD